MGDFNKWDGDHLILVHVHKNAFYEEGEMQLWETTGSQALQLVVAECKPKVKIVDLCKGDNFIREQSGNMYKNVKKEIERGIAFPTCVSVNNTMCHFSPLASDDVTVEAGDIVKIDMGCHIDGFIAVVAHTHVVCEGPVTGKAADVIAAASTAAEVVLRLVRPGKKADTPHLLHNLASFSQQRKSKAFCDADQFEDGRKQISEELNWKQRS